MTSRLISSASDAVVKRSSRRGFLAKSAMAGSAMVVAPTDFVLRPKSAYAALCRCQGQSCACGSLCCDGYTEFCCTLHGENTCPPNTLLGGWWKADGTKFCGSPAARAPRYYLDCNAPCGNCGCGSNGVCSKGCAGVACGCGAGNCDNRKSGCTEFRYGQCNQDVACIGPIMCRVVTCRAPWTLDASCGTTSATDQRTGTHDRPCLHERAPIGALDHVDETAWGFSVRGWALDPEVDGPIAVQILVDGAVVQTVTADRSRPDLPGATGFGPNHGFAAVVKVPAGKHRIDVRALNDYGPSETVGWRYVVTGRPFGELEVARAEPGAIFLRGWSIDPGRNTPPRIHVFIDSKRRAVVPARIKRVPIATVFGYQPKIGFKTRISIGAGSHKVSVWSMNDTGQPHRLIGKRRLNVPPR
jgi:hypothetical protein